MSTAELSASSSMLADERNTEPRSRHVCKSHDWSCAKLSSFTPQQYPYYLVPPHRGAGSPLPVNPISVTSVSGSSFPLNSGRNDASVYGQCTDAEPL